MVRLSIVAVAAMKSSESSLMYSTEALLLLEYYLVSTVHILCVTCVMGLSCALIHLECTATCRFNTAAKADHKADHGSSA